jgi:hypothetical protein
MEWQDTKLHACGVAFALLQWQDTKLHALEPVELRSRLKMILPSKFNVKLQKNRNFQGGGGPGGV